MEIVEMKEMDNVRIIVEKDRYVKEGVHKGMYGWICHNKSTNNYWLVNIPQCYDKPDIATLSVHKDDMEVVTDLYAKENERIKAQFGD